MKALAFTDVHGDLKALQALSKKASQADILLCTGDLSVFENHLSSILEKINALGKKTLIIHGNHEGEQAMRKECARFKNLVFLHKKIVEEEGIAFAGWGGGGFSMQDKAFEKFSQEITKKSEGKPLVLLFHGPPYGSKVDWIGDHAGNKSYTEYIRKRKPVLVLCGHLHENNGVSESLYGSLVLNPGPTGKIINITSSQ